MSPCSMPLSEGGAVTIPVPETMPVFGIPLFNHMMTPQGRLPRRHVLSAAKSLASLDQFVMDGGR